MLFLQQRWWLKPIGPMKMQLHAQPAVQQQDEFEVEGIGGDMNADQGELDEAIVDEMELDDEEYRTFIAGRDARLFENEDTILED